MSDLRPAGATPTDFCATCGGTNGSGCLCPPDTSVTDAIARLRHWFAGDGVWPTWDMPMSEAWPQATADVETLARASLREQPTEPSGQAREADVG